MGHTLTDSEIQLRPIEIDDAAEWLAGEDDEQIRWFEAPHGATLSDVQRFISDCRRSWEAMGDHRYWTIRRINSPEILGGIDLRRLNGDEVNVSYVVFPQYRRQGVALRASALVVNYAAVNLGAKTAVFKMLPANVHSRSVAVRLGAEYFGEEPSDAGATFQVFKLALFAK
jgi:RimJ/RimL family protein N-acetyltransferase